MMPSARSSATSSARYRCISVMVPPKSTVPVQTKDSTNEVMREMLYPKPLPGMNLCQRIRGRVYDKGTRSGIDRDEVTSQDGDGMTAASPFAVTRFCSVV